MERVIELLLQDAGVAALMDKVQSVGRFTEEAENTLARSVSRDLQQINFKTLDQCNFKIDFQIFSKI